MLTRLMCLLRPHQWSDWTWETDDGCVRTSHCLRCGDIQREVHHDWGDWSYQKTGHCQRSRACRRCGGTQTTRTHDFDASTSRCRRCGALGRGGYSSDNASE